MKQRILALTLIIALIYVPGCSNDAEKKNTIEIYFASNADVLSGSAIDSETQTFAELTVPAVMERLLQSPKDTVRLTAFAPEGTELLNWSVTDGVANLDLSESFGQLTGINLTKAEYCIVLTLTQLNGIDSVFITVDGKTLPGAAVNTLSASDVLLYGETDDPITVEEILYFPLEDGTGLGSEKRMLSALSNSTIDLANVILEQLAVGPNNETMTAFLPAGGKIYASSIQQGICTVTMDKTMLESLCQPAETYELKLYAIVDSLCQLDDISAVRFRENGSPIEGWEDTYTNKS